MQGIANLNYENGQPTTASQRVLLGLTPDVVVTTQDMGAQEFRDQLASLLERETPTELSHKYMILRDIHSASNSLTDAVLKLVEEPPKSIRILLTSHSPGKTRPAIRSRCGRLYFPPHTPTSIRSVMEVTRELQPALPVLNRRYPPISTLEATVRYRYDLDQIVESIARGEQAPSSLRQWLDATLKQAGDDKIHVMDTLLNLATRYLGNRCSSTPTDSGFLDLYRATYKASTGHVENGTPDRGTSIPNGVLATLIAYNEYARLSAPYLGGKL